MLEGDLPIEGYYILGGFTAMAALLYLNRIIRGGLKGAHRITRHLWRMRLSLILPTLAFINQDIFPAFIKNTHWLMSPLFLIIAVMVYPLCQRILFQKNKVEVD